MNGFSLTDIFVLALDLQNIEIKNCTPPTKSRLIVQKKQLLNYGKGCWRNNEK